MSDIGEKVPRVAIRLNTTDQANQMVGKLEMWKTDGDPVATAILNVASMLNLPTEKLDVIAAELIAPNVKIAEDPEEYAKQFEWGKVECLNRLKQNYVEKVTQFHTVGQNPQGGVVDTTINVNKFNPVDGKLLELTLDEKFDLAKQRYKEKYGTEVLSFGVAWYIDFNMTNQYPEMSKSPAILLDEFPIDAPASVKIEIVRLNLQMPEGTYNGLKLKYDKESMYRFDPIDGTKLGNAIHREQKLYENLCHRYVNTVESQLGDQIPQFDTATGEKIGVEKRMLIARKMAQDYQAKV